MQTFGTPVGDVLRPRSIPKGIGKDGGAGAGGAPFGKLAEDAPRLFTVPLVFDRGEMGEDVIFDRRNRACEVGQGEEVSAPCILDPDRMSVVRKTRVEEGRQIGGGVVFEKMKGGSTEAALDGGCEFFGGQRSRA
jgi:hypothetical protein